MTKEDNTLSHDEKPIDQKMKEKETHYLTPTLGVGGGGINKQESKRKTLPLIQTHMT